VASTITLHVARLLCSSYPFGPRSRQSALRPLSRGTDKRERTSRAAWQKRIERWNDSGLSAEQFAAELGINAGTLRHLKSFLGKQGRRTVSARPPMASAWTLVEVRASDVATATVSPFEFELELGANRKLRIPPQFDVEALERLLAVLEHR